MFGLLAVGEVIWVAMETYCLQRAMTYERELNWDADWSFGKRLGNRYEIISGINEGDKIVTEGQVRLKDGVSVTVK